MGEKLYNQLPKRSRLIRLLEVFPGELNTVTPGPVICALHEVPIDSRYHYTALSYAWKTFNRNENHVHPAIICNRQYIHVTANLFHALCRLRHHESSVILWVDSLCINQTDNNERTHQVGMMREIYQNSDQVVIWLGEPSAYDDLGTFLVGPNELRGKYDWHGDERDAALISSYSQEYYRSLRRMVSPRPASLYQRERQRDVFGAFCLIHQLAQGASSANIEFYNRSQVTSDYGDEWASSVGQGLWALIELPWWRRTWVVQETVVAPKAKVYYGGMSAPWDMFSKAAINFSRELSLIDLSFMESQLERVPLIQFTRLVLEVDSTRSSWISRQPMTILSLLRRFRAREASDKRDKIYGLLGMTAPLEYGHSLSPNYELDAEQVFRDTTIHIISTTKSLSVLAGTLRGHVRGAASSESKLPPSWVADWSVLPEPHEYDRLKNLEMYNASAGIRGPVYLHNDTMLEVHGLFVDVISSVGSTAPDGGMSHLQAVVRQWERMTQEGTRNKNFTPFIFPRPVGSSEEFITPETLMPFHYSPQSEPFWRTICADTLHEGQTKQLSDNKQSDYRRAGQSGVSSCSAWISSNDLFHRRRKSSLIGNGFVKHHVNYVNKDKNAFHYALETASASRAFFITAKGYFGVGPHGTQKGDQVYVVMGSRVPFVVRPEHVSDFKVSNVKVLIAKSNADVRGETVKLDLLSCYRLIGDAYVNGHMDGEAVVGPSGHSEAPRPIYFV